MKNQRSFWQLALPLSIEALMVTIVALLNTFMLSQSSDQSVGAVGTSAALISIFLISFNLVALGTLTVMTQYIGAGQSSTALKAGKLGLIINLLVGLVFTVLLTFFAENLLDFMGVNPDLRQEAITYTRILGSSLFIFGLTPILNHMSRSFGYTNGPLVGTIGANLANLIMHYLFVYGGFGLPKLGVVGVAIGVTLARLTNLTINIIGTLRGVPKNLEKSSVSYRQLFKETLSIGVPGAAENVLYSFAITTVVSFINQISSTAVITRTYLANLFPFVFIISTGIGGATSILVGWFVGQGDITQAYRQGMKSVLFALLASGTTSLLFYFFARPLISIFTTDPEILKLGTTIFLIDFFLELGRAINMVLGAALKASGDARFTLYIGLGSMGIIIVGLTWFLGLYLGFGLVGIWAALAADEVIRSFLMLGRWISRKWATKSLVKKQTVN